MHSNKENPVEPASAGHIYAVIGLKDTTTGDTLCDPNHQVVLESMTFPDPVIEVAIEPKTKSDQEKLGLADPEARRGGPDLQGAPGQRDRPDRHRRHGRAAPRHPRGPDAPRVQGRGQRRQAAGGLQGDHQARGREGRVHPQEADGWLRPVREGARQHRAVQRRGRRDLRVREQGHRRPHPARVHPVGGCRCAGRHAVRRAGRLPAGEPEADAARRRLPRRRLVGNGLQDRRLAGAEEGCRSRRSRSSWNRSWPSRSPRPRTTWAK